MTILKIYTLQGVFSRVAEAIPFTPKDELREQPFPPKAD